MTETGHAIIGAAIATKIPDLRISIPLILLSHVLGDLPDHWDTGENWQEKGLKKVAFDSIIDLTLGFILVTIIFVFGLGQDPATMFIAVFASQFFDYLEFPHFFLHWKGTPWSWINDFNHLFHKKIPSFNLTATWQAIISGVFLLWAFT
ncbi:hypothetical protein HY440_00475 [Candidatus Microgenomates bacterium]|nr:hypothetical protein [Candidatus Microgenomates bacterium]